MKNNDGFLFAVCKLFDLPKSKKTEVEVEDVKSEDYKINTKKISFNKKWFLLSNDIITCSIGYEDYVTSLAILYHKSDLDLVNMLKSLPKDKTSTKQKKKRNKNKKTFGKNK